MTVDTRGELLVHTQSTPNLKITLYEDKKRTKPYDLTGIESLTLRGRKNIKDVANIFEVTGVVIDAENGESTFQLDENDTATAYPLLHCQVEILIQTGPPLKRRFCEYFLFEILEAIK